MDALSRRTITGANYSLVLPSINDVRAFTRAVDELTSRTGLDRPTAVRRLADRCNLKVITP